MGLYIKSNDLFSKQELSIPEGPVVVGVEVENEMNMGAMIRLACNFGSTKVLFAFKEIPGLNIAKINRTAHSSQKSIEWTACNYDKLVELKKEMPLIAVETAKHATDLTQTELPEKCAILVGGESWGMPEEVLELCDQAVYIPMPGSNKSMNVSHALGTGLYEWFRQQHLKIS